MKQSFDSEEKEELDEICNVVRTLVEEQKYEECDIFLKSIIGKYPHAPAPQNLFGILFEKEGNHIGAMKHFRAAWALDPTYLPARYNIDQYTKFYAKDKCAFDESDCPQVEENHLCSVEYDQKGIGRIIRRIRI